MIKVILKKTATTGARVANVLVLLSTLIMLLGLFFTDNGSIDLIARMPVDANSATSIHSWAYSVQVVMHSPWFRGVYLICAGALVFKEFYLSSLYKKAKINLSVFLFALALCALSVFSLANL